MSATFLAMPAEGRSMNRVVIVLTVAGTFWLPNASALAQSKGQGAGPPAGAGSSATHGMFGSISKVGVISVPPAIPASIPSTPATPPGFASAPPGLGNRAPGLAATAPGMSGSAPGRAGTSPGHSGNAPGQSGTATSQSGSSSSSSGNNPGQGGSASGSGDGTTGNDSPSSSGATQVAQQAAGGQPAEAKRVSLHSIPSCY